MQQGIDPTTGLSVWGARQAECRLFKAITTQLGSRENGAMLAASFENSWALPMNTIACKLLTAFTELLLILPMIYQT